MSFRARSFIFDDIPSETYDLFIISEGGSGVIESPGSNSVTIFSQEIYRRSKPYFFGTQQTPVLTFNLSFASIKPIDVFTQQKIQRWLFGHSSYKKLQIMQCDMDYVYFNCILSEPTITTVGNYAYTFRCTVTCDAPWAWEWPQTYSVGKIANNGTFEFDNISDDNYYMYPKISFTTTGTSCGIINVTDKNNGPTFKDLIAGETITMDSDRCILTSSRDVLRLSNMTGCFLRLVPGVNTIKITGGINSMTIEYQNARKVIG